MANKKFLETYPLYRKFFGLSGISCWTMLKDIPKPAIHMYCFRCESEQTFNMTNQYDEVDFAFTEHLNGKTLRLKYVCSSCDFATRLFFVHFEEESQKYIDEKTNEEKEHTVLYAMKVGQNPSWDIEMDKELEGLLGDHAELYRKGLICESQGYGIGAYAYFRRVTESVIDGLLESISDLIAGNEKKIYELRLTEVKKEKIAEKKINLVKDMLPQSLQVSGMNPLKNLYDILSLGIHNMTDEECMEKAEATRSILVFLVNQIMKTKNDKKSFTEGMKKILRK